MEGTTNTIAKLATKVLFMKHLFIQMQEGRDYWTFRCLCFIFLNFYMSIIVDNKDQNTNMVSKMRQLMMNIENEFVKTLICGALVHGVGMYCDLWLDIHHNYDNIQVIMTLLYMIIDV